MPAAFVLSRVLALFAAFWISNSQFRYFDCNYMRGTSLIGGIVTVLLAYGTLEVLYRNVASGLSDVSKVWQCLLIALGGIGLVGVAAVFTMFTHFCP